MTGEMICCVVTMFMAGYCAYQGFIYVRHNYRATSRSTEDWLDECVARAVIGPDSFGRCRQCQVPVTDDMIVVHARLWHDRDRPRGPEDDQRFIESLGQ